MEPFRVHFDDGVATLPAGIPYSREVVDHQVYQGDRVCESQGGERVRLLSYSNETGHALVSFQIAGCGRNAHLNNVFVTESTSPE